MYCPDCGEKTIVGKGFCAACGCKLPVPAVQGIETQSDDVKSEGGAEQIPFASPWKRFFARIFDLWWESLLIGFIGGHALSLQSDSFIQWIREPGSELLLGMLCVPLALLMDALIYKFAGNTPGKYMLGISVETSAGSTLGFGQYLERNFAIWMQGLALGLPLFNLGAMAYQHGRLRKNLPATYDEKAARKVRARHVGWPRIVAFGVAFNLICLAMILLKAENSLSIDKATPTAGKAHPKQVGTSGELNGEVSTTARIEKSLGEPKSVPRSASLEEAIRGNVTKGSSKSSESAKQANIAADRFWGYLFINTRGRVAYCKELGVDIAPFKRAMEDLNRSDIIKAKAIYGDYGASADTVYESIRSSMRGVLENDMKNFAQEASTDLVGACRLFSEHGLEIAKEMQFAKIQPSLHRALLEY